jgi:hypothetical protein
MPKIMEVFKYLHEERIDVLENRLIRFTQFGNFNDPFEALPSIESILPKDQVDSIIRNLINLVSKDEMEEIYQAEIKKLIDSKSLSQDDLDQLKRTNFDEALELGLSTLVPHLTTAFNLEDEEFKKSIPYKFRDGLDKALGILTVSEINNNMLMWSHYANSHKGFVLIFDSKHDFFDQRKTSRDQARVLRKVLYKNERPNITLYDPSHTEAEFINLFIENVILTKHSKWSYEKEWRMAHMLNAADKTIEFNGEEIYLFKFPPEVIKGVIFGSRMNTKLKDKIIHLVESDDELNGISFFQADLDMQNYQINIYEHQGG